MKLSKKTLKDLKRELDWRVQDLTGALYNWKTKDGYEINELAYFKDVQSWEFYHAAKDVIDAYGFISKILSQYLDK